MEKKLNFFNLKEDYVFKYLFGKKSKYNRAALKSLIEDFTNVKVDNLEVLSPELECGFKFEKKTFFDIYAQFNEGNTIDIEMQMVNKRHELQPRMLYYLSKMLNSQLGNHEEYTSLKECYVLLFTNFALYYDSRLVHDFTFLDEYGTPLDMDKQYVHIITVELPKIKNRKELVNEQEKWAYLLEYNSDKDKAGRIEKLMEEKEGIYMAIQASNQLSESELEWFRKYQEERSYKEEASFDAGVLAKHEYIGEQRQLEKVILAFSKHLSPSKIAEVLNLSIDEVLSIIESAKGKQQ